MKSIKDSRFKLSLQVKFFLSIVLIITPVLGLIFAYAGIRSERNATAQTINQARVLARQIILTRQWVSDCGGVMVERNSPGAGNTVYFVDDRLNTERGTFNRFTPSMVTKKLSQYSMRENMYNFRLASLNPMNPENRPDAFERMALRGFIQNNSQEAYFFDSNDRARGFRYIAPLYVDQACMECHKDFTAGTIAGCLSISFPTENIVQSLKRTYINLAMGGGAIILLTSLTLFFFLRKMVIKPVNQIKSMATEISNGHHQARVQIKTGDELEQLGRAFNTMGERLSRNREVMEEKIAAATSELYQANQELKKLDTLKTEFIADMSHELRSPVTAIQGGLDYLKRKITKGGNKSYLAIIDNNLLRLTHLISDMLDLTRIEAGKVRWVFEQNDMAELIREVIEILSLKAREKSISLDFDYQGPMWAAMDLERIEQVLVNLIENAIKFSSESSYVEISAFERDRWVHVSIKDFGIGIADQDLETIFQKFHTLPSSGGGGRAKGTGLGLTISRKIVEAHQGRIWAESLESRGSVFHFEIPGHK